MVSIGVRPTVFEQGKRMVEVNLLDFDGDLYGRTISVQFLKRLRDERKFEGAQQLIEQMHRDKEESRKLEVEFRTQLKQEQNKN